ncbi:NAD(P)-binding protein [Punctularia strigosozonata HHB-11173 SS5]|uniref:NAD(P)-binding protein n=1 Tax=Punctularia strigosozonata (strain HHB-11173) TaxID=741275 RepID=UPI0004418303|nr:NAD(P)-binding protein [Punctularia strigosozonata HHB-11173 SS5]EIN12004.1 NAD(P)-binding protein [Punctularia strigosozonata HHB-11173 SS5]
MAPRVWLITGSSVGFGRLLTELVLSKGEIVVATLRKPEILADLAAKYPPSQLLVVKLDVTNEEDVDAAFAKVKETFGRLDIVVNNAGYGLLAEIEGTPLNLARTMFEVNFWGAANIARRAVEFFRDVNKPQGGRLLHLTSIVALQSQPGNGYYSASKCASDGLIEAFAKEIDPSWNIKLTLIEPGAFQTRGTSPESLVSAPQHPAYTFPGSITKAVRDYVPVATLPGDAEKLVHALYAIANEKDTPLRVPLGDDAVNAALSKAKSLKADAERVQKAEYAQDLLLDTPGGTEPPGWRQ